MRRLRRQLVAADAEEAAAGGRGREAEGPLLKRAKARRALADLERERERTLAVDAGRAVVCLPSSTREGARPPPLSSAAPRGADPGLSSPSVVLHATRRVHTAHERPAPPAPRAAYPHRDTASGPELTHGRPRERADRQGSTSQACDAESLRRRKLDQLLQHFGDADAAEDRAGEYAENAVRFFLFCLARGEARRPEAAAAIVRPLLLDAETVFAAPDRRSRGHAFCCSRPCSAVFMLCS